MKIKFFLLTSIVTLFLFSCEGNEPESETMYTLSANPTSLQFQAAGNAAQTVAVTAENMSWSASVGESGNDWINIEYNETTVTVNVSDNETLEPRIGTITILPEIENVKPVEISVEQLGKEAPDPIDLTTEGLIFYYGQNFLFPTNNNDEWLIELCTADSEYEISWTNFGKEGYWSHQINNGRLISLYMYCTPSEDFFNPDIEDGTYTACYEVGTMENLTFLTSTYYLEMPWSQGSYITDYSNGNPEYVDITDGKVVLEHNGDEYRIYMALTLKDGSKVAYNFSGNMRLSTLATPPYYSDLEDDLEIGQDEIAACSLVATYSNYNNPDISEWKLQFTGKDIVVDELGSITGDGYYISTHLFSPASENIIIPDGTYEINVTDSFYDVTEFGAMIGTYDPFMGSSGCYIEMYEGDNLDFAPMSSGTIKTTYLGDDTYRFEFNAMDDNNHSITFTYEGYVNNLTGK